MEIEEIIVFISPLSSKMIEQMDNAPISTVAITGNMKGRITVIQMPSRHGMRGTGYTGMACYGPDLYSMKTRTQRGITKE